MRYTRGVGGRSILFFFFDILLVMARNTTRRVNSSSAKTHEHILHARALFIEAEVSSILLPHSASTLTTGTITFVSFHLVNYPKRLLLLKATLVAAAVAKRYSTAQDLPFLRSAPHESRVMRDDSIREGINTIVNYGVHRESCGSLFS